MGMAKEFKEFAMKGNVVDMAVGIIIGAAFGKIVSSFVANVISPIIGLIVGGVDLKTLNIVLQEAPEGGKPVLMEYGIFLQNIFDFIIVAFAIFMVIKGMNSMKRKEEEKPAAPAAPPEDITLLREIRDSLKK